MKQNELGLVDNRAMYRINRIEREKEKQKEKHRLKVESCDWLSKLNKGGGNGSRKDR